MILRYFVALLVFCATSNLWAFSDCVDYYELDLGVYTSYEAESNIDNIYDYEQKQAFAKKLHKTKIVAELISVEKNTGYRLCTYSSEQNPELIFTTKETRKYFYLELNKSYSTLADNSDLTIFANDLLVRTRQEKPKNANKFKIKNAEVTVLYDYYSSCGFLECTSEGRIISLLGTISTITIKPLEHSAPSITSTHWQMARILSENLGFKIGRRCVVTEASNKKKTTYLIPFGSKEEPCGDVHYGLRLDLDNEGQFIRLEIIDS